MENRGTKGLALAALIVGVVGLSIGFAAFSNTLTISSSATVTPDSSSFDVNLVAPASCTNTGTGVTSSVGTVDNSVTDKSTISGVKANLKNPGDKVECTYTVSNVGQYAAYLTSMGFATTSTDGKVTNGKVLCEGADGTTESLVESACNSITVTAKLGETSPYTATVTHSVTSAITGTKPTTALAATSGTATLVLTIDYNGTGRADGTMDVYIPDLVLNYSSVQ